MEGKRTSACAALLSLARHEPGRVALTLIDGQRQQVCWRYHHLLLQQATAAHWLQQYGAVAGDCIVVIAGNSPHVIALLLASMQLRCCFVPFNSDVSVPLLQTALQELQPRLVIVEHIAPSRMRLLLAQRSARLVRMRPLQDAWLREILVRTPVKPVLARKTSIIPPGTVLLLYSSGSTGSPKAICYTDATLATFLDLQRLFFAAFADHPDTPAELLPSDRINVQPLAHFGCLSFCLHCLLEGRAVHLLCNYSAADYISLARQCHCQFLLMVPALYEPLLRACASGDRPGHLRYCVTMGEAISLPLAAQVQAMLGASVYQAYSMSEGLSGIGHTAAGLRLGVPAGSCGRLLLGEVQLRDASGRTNDSEGELFVRNATTSPRYLHAKLNDSRYEDGWYRTGDLLRRDADGYYFFQGRADDLCIVNGRKLYPAEVEAVMRRHAQVHDCLAAPILLSDGRKRLGAVVVSAVDNRPSVTELLDFCLAHGALHAVPAWIVFCAAVPLGGAGKRDRKLAAAWLQQDYATGAQQVS